MESIKHSSNCKNENENLTFLKFIHYQLKGKKADVYVIGNKDLTEVFIENYAILRGEKIDKST
jgi:hypothetical protein